MVKNNLMTAIREATGSREEAMKYDLAISSWCPGQALSKFSFTQWAKPGTLSLQNPEQTSSSKAQKLEG